MRRRVPSWIFSAGVLLWQTPWAVAYPDRVAGSVPLTIQPGISRLSPAGRYLYLLAAGGNSLSVVDTLSFREAGSVPVAGAARDFALGAGGGTLYMASDGADRVGAFDLANPAEPAAAADIQPGTSGVTFEKILVGGSGEGEFLALLDADGPSIYIYEIAGKRLRTNGAANRIALDGAPVSVRLTSDGLRVAALSADGKYRTYSTASLGAVGTLLDLGARTTAPAFAHLQIGLLGSGNYGFAANGGSPGGVFVVNMADTSTNVLALVDADPSTPEIDPIPVGADPSATLLAQVPRPENAATGSATYLFAANRSDGTLSVVDAAAIGAGRVEPLGTLSGVPDVPADGLAASGAAEGYLYACNQSGSSVTILTDQPFLTLTNLPSGSISDASATVTLRSTRGGELGVYRYTGAATEPISPARGESLATLAVQAETDTDVTFSTAKLSEGANVVAFFVRDGEFLGRAAAEITKDTPPPPPRNFALSFGNRKIFARWSRVSEADISHYLLYVGTDADAGSGVGGIASPVKIDQPASGNLKSTLEPIDNGTVVYAKVVTVDRAGHVSPPTEILSETPEETVGLLAFSGEEGGCRAGARAPLLLLLLPGAFLRARRLPRRGRRGHAAARIALLLLLAFLEAAFAQATVGEKGEGDSPHGSVEFRVGWWLPSDRVLDQFLGGFGNEIYSLRAGWLIGPFDVGLEAGFLRESAAMLGATTGRRSGENTRLTLIPWGFSGQYNLAVGKRPLAVPFARAGYQPVYFKVSEPGRSESGVKQAVDLALGVRLMLDRLGAGADLEDLLGIRRFFLEGVALYRYQFGGGLDFGGWIFHPGLGVEF